MGFLEQKITAAILGTIRKRRKASHCPSDAVRFGQRTVPPTLRKAAFSDFSAVAALKQRWGLSPDSFENWERLWRFNPALPHIQSDRPMGWVLEAEGRVVGYLGNISLLYQYGDRRLTAVAGHGFVIEPAYRAAGVSLNAAFYRQKSVDLYLTTSAIASVGKMARAFKADPLPQSDYDTVLFWVLQPYRFAEELTAKLELNTFWSRAASVIISWAVSTDTVLRLRWPRSSEHCAVREIALSEIGDDFQDLWIHKCKEKRQLLADRSPVALQWHFAVPGDKGDARVLCCYHNRELLGYAVIRTDTTATGQRKSVVADMIIKHDDAAVAKILLVAAYENAKQLGSYVLEVFGFPQSIRQVCSQWNPYQRKYPACPFYYKAGDPYLHESLSHQAEWYASPFDGDTTLIRPSFSSSGKLLATIDNLTQHGKPVISGAPREE